MASPSQLGSRSWWMAIVVVALVCGTMAAPQQDRRQIKVSASFGGRSESDSTGNSRALSQLEEPFIITEALPGQEFVFISANPRQSQAAGGRTAKLNPISAQLPSVRIESTGSGTILEDGILIAKHLGESNRDVRLLDEPSEQPTFAVPDADSQSWASLSLPELLTGPAIVREQEPLSSIKSNVSIKIEEAQSLSSVSVPVAEKFSFQDAVNLPSLSEKVEQVSTPVVIEERARQSKAIEAGSQDDDNLIAAESVSRRTVVKTAPNGQDYEYEYLYYDGIDVDEANTSSAVHPQEPTLFSNDQENANVSPIATNEADIILSSVVQLPFPVEEEISVTTESDLVEVQEIPRLDEIVENANDESFDAFTTEDFDAIAITEEATITTSTTTFITTTPTPTTTDPAVSFRRRRPTTTATIEATMRPSLSRLTSLRRGNTPAVTEEPITTTNERKRIRGKNRFSSESLRGTPAVNTVATESKTDESGRRRIVRPRIRSSTTSTLENRAGLAEIRFEQFEGEIEEADLADIAEDASLGTGLDHEELDFSRQSQPVERFPVRGRIPETFQEEQEAGDFFEQERTPLRVVESDSFRNTANQGSVGEQPVSVGRLTVISGPARLPPPLVVNQFEDVAEKEEIERPTFDSVQDFIESSPQVAADFEGDTPAAEPQEFIHEINNQEVAEVDTHTDNVSPFSLNHPSLSDILAFSKAAEQQQQDDETIQVVPSQDFEELLIEEVLPTTVSPIIPSAMGVPQIHSFDEKLGTEIIDDVEIQVNHNAQLDVADFVDEIVTTPHSVALSIEPVITTFDTDLSLTNDVDIQQTTDSLLERVLSKDVDVQNIVADSITETLTEVTPATTITTTTTTVASTTTLEPTTTAPPAPSIRTPSRFGGSSINANRFNNRIRNRIRLGSNGAPAVASTTTTTGAPVKKNTFRPAGSPFNRLRRPTTPSTDTVKSTSSEAVDAAAEVADSSSPSSVVPLITRKPFSNNFRNRFQFRRNQTETSQPVEPSVPSEEPKAALPTVRPRPVGTSRLQSNRVILPRPMSSILRRGRFTTTTTTEAAPVVGSAEETSTNETGLEPEQTNETPEKTEDDGVDPAEPDAVSEKVVTVATEPPTTTTSRSAGLNRLKNRVLLPVSERPKTVRTQISLSDRRNRFSVLSNKKAESEADSSVANEEDKEEKLKAVDVEEEEVTGKETEMSAVVPEGSTDSSPATESNVDAATSATVAPVSSLRNRRPSRIPGQLAARRTLSS